MSEHVWAKVYLELPTDPKLVGRSAHDCYLWVCLILIAKSGDGTIPAWQAQAKYLSKYARISLKEVVTTLCYFEDVGMLAPTRDGGFVLPRFAKRQGSSDPKAAERMRTLRERSPNIASTHAGTEAEGRGLTSPSPKETETDHLPPRRQAPEDVSEFREFWDTYPKNDGSKKVTLQRWTRLSESDRNDALIGAKNYAGCKRVGEGYVKYAEAWISERRWEAYQHPENSGNGSGKGDSPPPKKYTFVMPDGTEIRA